MVFSNVRQYLPSWLGGNSSTEQDGDSEGGLTFTGGVSLLVGSMTGPGLVTIPLLYQNAGWFFPTLAFIIVAILSGVSSSFVCEVLSYQSRRRHPDEQIEFGSLAESFLSKRWRIPLHIWLFLSLQTVNVASIILSIQSMDRMILTLAGRTCGLSIYPKVQWLCVDMQTMGETVSANASPFNDAYMLFTFGLLIAVGIVGPLGFLRLVDNAIVQILSMGGLIVITVGWMVTFCELGLSAERLPAVTSNLGQVIGTVLFNYAFITTVPSWINSKKSTVSTKKSIWWSIGISTVLYILLGVLGSMAIDLPAQGDILSALEAALPNNMFIRISSYVFPIAVLITSIPVFTIVVRYNLIHAELVRPAMAGFLSGVLPWIVAIPFQSGDLIMTLMNLASLFFTSAVNFILPFVMYLLYRRFKSVRPVHRPSSIKIPTVQINNCPDSELAPPAHLPKTKKIPARLSLNNPMASNLLPTPLEVDEAGEDMPDMPPTPKITLLEDNGHSAVILSNTSITPADIESLSSNDSNAENKANHQPSSVPLKNNGSGGDGLTFNIVSPVSSHHLSVPTSPQTLPDWDMTVERNMEETILHSSTATTAADAAVRTRDRRTSAPEVHNLSQRELAEAMSAFIPSGDGMLSPTEIRRPHAKSMNDLKTIPSAQHLYRPALSPTELFSNSNNIRSNIRQSMDSIRRTLSWYGHNGQSANGMESPLASPMPSTIASPRFPPSVLPPFRAFSEMWRPRVICQVSLVFMTCGTLGSIVLELISQITRSGN